MFVTAFSCVAYLNLVLSDPSIAVTVSGDVAPVIDVVLDLTCDVSGAELITDRAIVYQWSRNGMMVPSQIQRSWSFTPLAYSDAGQYTCAVELTSGILPTSPISAVSTPFNVTLTCESWHNFTV